MKRSHRSRHVLSISAVTAMLTACGGSQPPIGAPGAMPQTFALAAHADRGTSWMLPEAASQDLLYVSSHNYVSIYTYPGGQLVGKLRGFYLASGQCVDSSNNVYITDYGMNRVFEYAHGNSKRLRTILTPGGNSCSID